MSTNLYDLLDVDEHASADEIRAAWKRAIADLDPTERRFRAYNDAAGVLLDPDKRAAHDADLAEQRAAAPDPDEDADAAAPVELSKQGHGDEPEHEVVEPAAQSAPAAGVPDGAGASTGPGAVALIAVSIVAVLLVALSVWLVTRPGATRDPSAQQVAAQNLQIERDGVSAEGAAEAMVGPVLSYDHKTMSADLERRAPYLTEKFRTTTERSWPDLTKEAEAQKIVVEAKPVGTALTRVSPNGKKATVVVFIDQYVTKDKAQPFVLRMWATFTMVASGRTDHPWLLDDLCTDASCQ